MQLLHSHQPSLAGPLWSTKCLSQRRSKNHSQKTAGARELPGACSLTRCHPSAQAQTIIPVFVFGTEGSPGRAKAVPATLRGSRSSPSALSLPQSTATGSEGGPSASETLKPGGTAATANTQTQCRQHSALADKEIQQQTYSGSPGSAPLSAGAAGLGCWSKCRHLAECRLPQALPVQRHAEVQSVCRAARGKDCPSEGWLAQMARRAHGKGKALGSCCQPAPGLFSWGFWMSPAPRQWENSQGYFDAGALGQFHAPFYPLFCKMTATRY